MQKIIDIKTALDMENSVFVDVRSKGEYDEDHIKDAVNIPLLEDDERKNVGTIYKTMAREDAIKVGIDIVSPKLNELYKSFKEIADSGAKIILYCARGGMRSSSLANFLTSLGLDIYKVEGGYKEYRNYVINFIENISNEYKFIVLHGLTGVGKTVILNKLEEKNIDVIDLEEIAKNSGSVFGHVYFEENPPSQKRFETEIFNKIYYSKSKYLFIESESKRIGTTNLPDGVYNLMQEGSLHILVDTSIDNRVKILVDQYVSTNNKSDEAIENSIKRLNKRMGNDKVVDLIEKLNDKDYAYIAKNLIVDYYDPLYKYSIEKYKYNLNINYDSIDEAIGSIVEFYKSFK